MNEEDPSKYIITLSKYNNLSFIHKIKYRIIHTPILFFTIFAPIYTFWIQHIFIYKNPLHLLKRIVFYSIIFKFGGINLIKKIFIGQLVAGILGIILFHLQHSVNNGYWESFDKKDELSYYRAQLHGLNVKGSRF